MDGSDPGLAGGAAVELTQALIQAAQSATQAAQAAASVNAAQAQGGGEGSSSGSSKRDLAKRTASVPSTGNRRCGNGGTGTGDSNSTS